MTERARKAAEEWMRKVAEDFLELMGFSSDPEMVEQETQKIIAIISRHYRAAQTPPSSPSSPRANLPNEVSGATGASGENLDDPETWRGIEQTYVTGAQTTESTPPTPTRECYMCQQPSRYSPVDPATGRHTMLFSLQSPVNRWPLCLNSKSGAAQTPGETCPDPDQFCIGDSGRSPAPAPQKEICDCCDETLENCRCGCTHDPD